MINTTKNLKRKKKALITGISGQDGSTLTEILLEKDYEIFDRQNAMGTAAWSGELFPLHPDQVH